MHVEPIPSDDQTPPVPDFMGPKLITSAANETVSKYEKIARQRAAAAKRRAEKAAEEERRFQAEMSIPVPEEPIEIVKVRAGDVMFDRRYQTPERFDLARARKIARSYDRHRMREIDINKRPGDPTETPWCIDGQHRVSGTIMRLGPDALMDARLHRVSYEREAALFAHQHDDEKPIPIALRFNAEAESGDEQALAAKALAEQLGLALGRNAGNGTVPVVAFLHCCKKKGLEATQEGLQFVLDRWHGSHESLEGEIVKGVVWFVANRRDDPNYLRKNVSEALARIELADLENKARVLHPKPLHQGIAAALVLVYNRNRRNTLPEWKALRGEK